MAGKRNGFKSDAQRKAAFANMKNGPAPSITDVHNIQAGRTEKARKVDGKSTSKDTRLVEDEDARRTWAKHPGKLDLDGIDTNPDQDVKLFFGSPRAGMRWKALGPGSEGYDQGLTREEYEKAKALGIESTEAPQMQAIKLAISGARPSGAGKKKEPEPEAPKETECLYEKNSKGQLLVSMPDIAGENLENYSRYNGGWIKKVDGLNKEVTNGYSILGGFCEKGKTWNAPGLYMDCSIDGSRKNQERRYTLFRLNPDGTVEQIGDTIKERGMRRGDWAVDLWKPIEKELKKEKKK